MFYKVFFGLCLFWCQSRLLFFELNMIFHERFALVNADLMMFESVGVASKDAFDINKVKVREGKVSRHRQTFDVVKARRCDTNI